MTRRYSAVAVTAMALLTGLLWAGSAAAYSPQLMRFPYLTDVVGTSATVKLGHRSLAQHRAGPVWPRGG